MRRSKKMMKKIQKPDQIKIKIWTRIHFTDDNRRPLSRAVKYLNIWTRTHFADDNRRPLRKAASQIKHLHKTLYKYIGKSAWGK